MHASAAATDEPHAHATMRLFIAIASSLSSELLGARSMLKPTLARKPYWWGELLTCKAATTLAVISPDCFVMCLLHGPLVLFSDGDPAVYSL